MPKTAMARQVFNMPANMKIQGFFLPAKEVKSKQLSYLLIKKSVECNIDLNAKDDVGMTGFHYYYHKIEQVKKMTLDHLTSQ